MALRSGLRSKAATTITILGIAVPAAAHSAHARLERRTAERELAALSGVIEPIATSAGDGVRRVTLNGAPLLFRAATVPGSLDDALAAVERECRSGALDVALAFPSSDRDDGRSRSIELEHVVSQESTSGARAMLCVFAMDGADRDASRLGTPREPVHRVRYTFARAAGDGRTSLTTVVNASSAPLAALFPADGDAPGSDLPDVARPASSRRALTAVIGDGEYSVRVYESALAMADAVARYDTQMAELGYATTASLPDARMYRRNGESFAVAFQPTTGGTSIAIAPFERGSR